MTLLEQILTLIRGARNGAYYGMKLRFVHTLVMTLLFRQVNINSIKAIFMFAFEHAYFLAKFVFTYKGICLLMDKLCGKRLFNNFIGGLLSGIIHNQQKTPVFLYKQVKYQIVLYLFARVTMALISIAFYKIKQNVKLPQQKADKYGFIIFAGICWGLVMLLFQYDKQHLQPSLSSSMQFLYKQSDKPLQHWSELIPLQFPSFLFHLIN